MDRSAKSLAPSAIIPPAEDNDAPCLLDHPLVNRKRLPQAQALVLVLLAFEGLSTSCSRVRRYVQKELWLPGKRHAHHRVRIHQRR